MKWVPATTADGTININLKQQAAMGVRSHNGFDHGPFDSRYSAYDDKENKKKPVQHL